MKSLLAYPLSIITHSRYVVPRRALALLVAALMVFGAGSARADAPFAPSKAVTALQAAAGESASLVSDPATGLIRHLGTGASPIAVTGADSEARARGFLEAFGGAFAAGPLELATSSVRDGGSSSHVRFAQTVGGIPVTAGAVHVQLNDAGILNVSASTLAGAPASLEPSLDTAAAVEAAAAAVDYDGAVSYSEPRLEVFNRGLIEHGGDWPTRLAWFVEATAPLLREYVWVDAADGSVLLSFSQLAEALDREVWDSGHKAIDSTSGATLINSDAGGLVTNLATSDDEDAWDFSSNSWTFFNGLGQDSFDDAGATIIANVQYCGNSVSGAPCPSYNAALWDGTQMIFSDGFTVEDVVGHEFTHGIVEGTAGLLYMGQSGAVTESFTDIFGELIDRSVNVGGTEAANPWLVGEDLTTGAIRNMMTPSAAPFYDPASTQDPLYYCGADDNGGVHTNSGVGNRAFALFIDGDGATFTGIGDDVKGAYIYLEALQTLLPAATWADTYAALNGACSAGLGIDPGGASGAITATDCSELTLALDAVTMNTPPACGIASVAACPAGETRIASFTEGFEDPAAGGWSLAVMSGTDHWSGGDGTPDIYWPIQNPRSGDFSAWGLGADSMGDSAIAMASGVTVPLDGRAMFWGDFQFNYSPGGTESDGGVVEYSTNGGTSWMDAAALFDAGQGYTAALEATNPLGARQAFTSDSGAYGPTRLDLSALAGQSLRFRFRVGTEGTLGDLGWYLDDISIYRCVASAPTDWNGDVYPDIFWNHYGTGENRVWTMQGGARTGTLTLPTMPAPTYRVEAIGDFNKDGIPDLVVTDTATGMNLIAIMNMTRPKRVVRLPSLPSSAWRIAAAADFNSDGETDIVAWNRVTGQIVIAYWDGAKVSGFKAVNRLVPPAVRGSLVLEGAGDMNRDGSPDLVWRDYASGSNWIQYLNNNLNAGRAKLPRVADPLAVIEQVSDFNLDGYMDILWRHYGGGRNQIWYMQNNARIGKVNIPNETDLDWHAEN